MNDTNTKDDNNKARPQVEVLHLAHARFGVGGSDFAVVGPDGDPCGASRGLPLLCVLLDSMYRCVCHACCA